MWRVLAELKRDQLGRVELLGRGEARLVRRVADGGALPLSRSIARVLLRRERRALEALDGLRGVPRLVRDASCVAAPSLDGRAPRADAVLVRSFVAGAPLHRCERLPLDFFERLEELVRALHTRGVAHNDLHKEQNVVVGEDGRPGLIDFQLASVHRPGSRALRVRALDDLRHVAKHRRRYLRYTRVSDERWAPPADLRADPPRAPKRRGAALVWRKTAKPLYHFVTRSLLERRDGEARRETQGPWPTWCAPTRPR
jgi:predicted Ser/Thr protein kinase